MDIVCGHARRLKYRTLATAVAFVCALQSLIPPPAAADTESYLTRPDVLSVQARKNTPLMPGWEQFKRANLEAAAQLLELYPDSEIYFIARDSEHLYDYARIAARNDPAALKRLKLINVSRSNINTPGFKEYLAQEGLSEITLKTGKKVVFVDTGFSGSIPKTITDHFPVTIHNQIKTHLMCSMNPAHPSSRVFLTALNRTAPGLEPRVMNGVISKYELMPRYFDRSHAYARINGRWTAISNTGTQLDGRVSKTLSRKYMEDLAAYAMRPENAALLEKRRALWRNLHALAREGNADKTSRALKQMLANAPTDPFAEAIVRDFIEAAYRNLPGISAAIPPPARIGLADAAKNNRQLLALKRPEWATFLSDPAAGAEKLVKNGNWTLLGKICDEIVDNDFYVHMAKQLQMQNPSLQTRKFIKSLVRKGDQNVLRAIAKHAISGTQAVRMKDILRMLIETGYQEVIADVVKHVFVKSPLFSMKDLIRLAIETGGQDVLRALAGEVFSLPQAAGMKDLIRLAAMKSGQNALNYLVMATFSKPHARDMKDLIRFAIETGKQDVLHSLAYDVFSKEHTAHMKDLLRLLLERADSNIIQAVNKYALTAPHALGSEYDVFRNACKIEDRTERIRFLEQKFPAGSKPKYDCAENVMTILQNP